MRSKYTDTASNGVHYFLVDWNPKELNWADFRGKLFMHIYLTRPISGPSARCLSREKHDSSCCGSGRGATNSDALLLYMGLAQLAHARQL